MSSRKSKQIIQVLIEEKLLNQIDPTAGIIAEPRNIQKTLRAKELNRVYIEGHQGRPENLD